MSMKRFWPALLAVVLTVAACHKRVAPAASPVPSVTPASPSAVPARPPAPPPPPAVAIRPSPTALSEEERFRRKSLDQLNAEQPLADAFFDYDQSELGDEARRTLQRDVQWLSRWPQTAIRIQGHCDERGTPEYNLALGERRADTVRDYLVSLGVRNDRIQIVSLGKEAPFCGEAGDSCWSKNRRGHFVITRK